MYIYLICVNANFTTSWNFDTVLLVDGVIFGKQRGRVGEWTTTQAVQTTGCRGRDWRHWGTMQIHNNATCSSFKVSKTKFLDFLVFSSILREKNCTKILGDERTLFILGNFVFFGVTIFFNFFSEGGGGQRGLGSKIEYWSDILNYIVLVNGFSLKSIKNVDLGSSEAMDATGKFVLPWTWSLVFLFSVSWCIMYTNWYVGHEPLEWCPHSRNQN